ADGRVPYVDHPVEYPVLIGAVMDLGRVVAGQAGDAGPGSGHGHATAVFYDVEGLLLTIATVATVVCTGLTAGRPPPWDAALVALAPTIVIDLATNWDMLAVGLASGALLAWARKRTFLAGILLGLGIAAKLYPVLFLLPLAALCWRAGRGRQWWQT